MPLEIKQLRESYVLCRRLKWEEDEENDRLQTDLYVYKMHRSDIWNHKCEVLMVGPGRLLPCGKKELMPVKPGDIVYIHPSHDNACQVGEGLLVCDVNLIECVYPK